MKDIPVKAVPMRIPLKPLPHSRAISAKAPPEVSAAIPIEERKWRCIPCAEHTIKGSLKFHIDAKDSFGQSVGFLIIVPGPTKLDF